MKRFFVLLAAVAMMSSCVEQKKVVVEQATKIITRAAIAQEATITLSEVFTSEIEPFQQNNITPAVAGVHIDKIFFDVGDHVSAGDLVVKLDPTQYNQQRLRLNTVQDDYDRLLPVFKAGGISAQQIEQAKAQLDIQKEIVANLKRNIDVTSPISGVVTARNYEAGDLFANSPILQIMQINPLKVIVNISEQYFTDVKVGKSVTIKVDIFPDLTFSGKVSLIYPALDAATRTFKVEVEVPNRYKTLRPGMYARTTFNMGEKSGVMVPDVAIQKQAGSSERFVYVIENGVALRRSVKVGRQEGSMVDILSGVSVGESVAITAISKLYDGVMVDVKEN